jgi:hypothetical protein
MAKVELTISVVPYFCEPCTQKQGTLVRELVRMIPKSVVFNGELIGDEFYCCPICFDPKFPVKKPRKAKGEQVAATVVKSRPKVNAKPALSVVKP